MRRRRLAGTILLVTGAALLTAAAGDVVRGAIARDRARAAWDRLLAQRAVASVERAAAARPASAAVQTGAPLARLRIPRLGLDEVVVEGVGNRELRAGPGHLPGSALPGDTGNSVISAHRDRHFRKLAALAVGDTVETETLAGTDRWVVTRRMIVRRGVPALFQTPAPALTLTTCWPINALGSAPERLLFEARPLS